MPVFPALTHVALTVSGLPASVVRAAGLDATAVRVETTATQPVPFYNVRGG
jgi:hypothetical protein